MTTELKTGKSVFEEAYLMKIVDLEDRLTEANKRREEQDKEIDSLSHQLMEHQSRPDFESGKIHGGNQAWAVAKNRIAKQGAMLKQIHNIIQEELEK